MRQSGCRWRSRGYARCSPTIHGPPTRDCARSQAATCWQWGRASWTPTCFKARSEEGRRALEDGDPARAAEMLREALGLWRGPALAEVAFEEFAQAEIRRLDELRLAALETRVEADLRLGQHVQLIVELQQLVTEYPWHERLHGQLMLALYRAGRQADALEAYQHARTVLIEQLGLEPGQRTSRTRARHPGSRPGARARDGRFAR